MTKIGKLNSKRFSPNTIFSIWPYGDEAIMTKQRNMHLADNMPSMPQEFKSNIEKPQQTA